MGKNRRFLGRLEPQQATLTAYCRRLLSSSSDLEDALQETLTVAYRRFVDLPDEDFRRWILRIATFVCFNANRRRRRGPVEEMPAEVPEDAVTALERECAYEDLLSDPSPAFEGFEDELARACRALPETERAVLLLKTLGGLTCAEIACALGVPLGTAQGSLTRARWKLRDRLVDFARARGYPTGRSAP